MTNLYYDLGNLKKLLKLAREDLAALRADLADIVSAQDALEKQMCAEKALTRKGGDTNINGNLENARTRKCNLHAASMSLRNAETDARLRLEGSMGQVSKFEQLVERLAPLAGNEKPVSVPLTAGDVFTANAEAG
ncbi:MAG: hypothetical protein AAF936_04685 [Pseudomonadota bacterium]